MESGGVSEDWLRWEDIFLKSQVCFLFGRLPPLASERRVFTLFNPRGGDCSSTLGFFSLFLAGAEKVVVLLRRNTDESGRSGADIETLRETDRH